MSDIVMIGYIVSVWILIAIEFMLFWQVRLLNTNFKQLFGKVDLMFMQLQPLIKALNKATPFLEVINGVIGFFKKNKRGRDYGKEKDNSQ